MKDVIPKEQLRRLDIRANERGHVIEAKAPQTLLEWLITENVLPYEALYYSNVVIRWRGQEVGKVKTAKLDSVQVGGDAQPTHYTTLVRTVTPWKLQMFLYVGELESQPKHQQEALKVVGEIRQAFHDVQKEVDYLTEA